MFSDQTEATKRLKAMGVILLTAMSTRSRSRFKVQGSKPFSGSARLENGTENAYHKKTCLLEAGQEENKIYSLERFLSMERKKVDGEKMRGRKATKNKTNKQISWTFGAEQTSPLTSLHKDKDPHVKMASFRYLRKE